jgi:hypothetical protein
MKIVDIADQIYRENGEPKTTSIPAIAYFLRTELGKLNVILYEDFWVEPSTLEIRHGLRTKPDGTPIYIGQMAVAILKLLYLVYQCNLDIRNMLVSVTTDSVLKATDQEFSIEKVNKSELLKTLTTLKKDTLKELQDLVHSYRSYYGPPQQIAGDDTEIGYYVDSEAGYVRGAIGNNTNNWGNEY